jgi:hypothetical protein
MDSRDFYCKTLLPTPKVDWQSIWGDESPATPKTLPWRNAKVGSLKNLWEPEIADKLISIGLVPSTLRVFKWTGNKGHVWHIDGNDHEVTQCAINWVMEGEGRIQWDPDRKLNWIADQHGRTRPINKARQMDPTTHSNKDDTFVCETPDNGNQCLVKTNITHRVYNCDWDTPRTTMSMVFQDRGKWTYERTRDALHKIGLLA